MCRWEVAASTTHRPELELIENREAGNHAENQENHCGVADIPTPTASRMGRPREQDAHSHWPATVDGECNKTKPPEPLTLVWASHRGGERRRCAAAEAQHATTAEHEQHKMTKDREKKV